ncbi:hypothetical protein D3C77_697470 [compost metagenome]
MQGRDLQEQVGDNRHQQHHEARQHHARQERHVFTGGQYIGRTAEEHHCGTAQRQHDQVTRASVQERTQDRAKGVAHKAGEGEGRQNTGRAIGQLMGQEHQTIKADQH